MNDRIIELAKQAGFFIDVLSEPMRIGVFHQKIDKELKRFAELVRADTLEAEPAPVQETIGGLDDATRIGWAMWRIKDLEQQLASRPAYIAQHPAGGTVTDEENERFSHDVGSFSGSDPEATMYALEQFLKRHTAPKAQQPAQEQEKIAPVQGYTPGIPWSLHLEAYDAYSKRWAPQPALIDLEGRGCRGGFSTNELDAFIPGWRDKISEIGRLRAQVADLKSRLTALQAHQPAPPACVPMLSEMELFECFSSATGIPLPELAESRKQVVAIGRSVEQAVRQKAGLK